MAAFWVVFAAYDSSFLAPDENSCYWCLTAIFFCFSLPFSRQSLRSEQRSAGLLEVKLIFQHIRYKKIMSVGDELWRRKSNRMKRTEVVTSSETLLELWGRFFHPSNKQKLRLISCLGYKTFPFFLTSERSATAQINETTEGRLSMWLCNEALWERLKTWNEAQGDTKRGQRPVGSYLAWLACKPVWCADHLALYPGREKRDDLIDFTTVSGNTGTVMLLSRDSFTSSLFLPVER